MTGYCVLDTETTGLFDWNRPADAPGQPRLASIAMIFLDADFATEFEWSCLIQPNGWEMTPEALAINGLTTERLKAEGLAAWLPLAIFSETIKTERTIVAFNSQFDLKVMRGELRRHSRPDFYENTREFCVMKAMTPLCKIPKANGGGFKWPNLSQAHTRFFGRPHEGAHGALSDARACRDIFVKLQKRIPDSLPGAS